MACISPLDGWLAKVRNPSRKRSVVFNLDEGLVDRPVQVPCGKCRGCRLEYARQWAMRCVHEASLYDENSFITLTYDNEHLPPLASLRKKDFTNFIKRLRSANSDRPIRYFQCGEYGSKTGRPHHHALLFGFDFRDKEHWQTRGGHPVFRSQLLQKKWKHGFTEVGTVTFESASYVARYLGKKFKNPDPEEVDLHYAVTDDNGEYFGQREPEYCTMSRRPGIGKGWFDKFGIEAYENDSVIMRGREMLPPRFYDDEIEALEPELYNNVKRDRRKKRAQADPDGYESSSSRLLVREKIMQARDNLTSREM